MTDAPDQSLARYQRQMLLPGFNVDAQNRFRDSRAVIIGCGALGCVVADQLCRAGVGRLTIVDRDVVELSNLHRQVLFDEADAEAGTPKSVAAAARLSRVNSSVRVEPLVRDVNSRNIESIISGDEPASPRASVVIDATDNFQARYLINDACVKLKVGLAYAGVVGTAGMVMTILPGTTACLRCLFPEPPMPGSAPTCDTAGVLGPMVGIVASMQACEAMKLLLGQSSLIARQAVWIDAWNNQRRTIDTQTIDRSACPCCGQRHFEFLDGPMADAGTTTLCGSDSVQVLGLSGTVDLAALEARLRTIGIFTRTRHLLRGRLPSSDASGNGEFELTVFADGRAIVRGTQDPVVARSVYSRYVG